MRFLPIIVSEEEIESIKNNSWFRRLSDNVQMRIIRKDSKYIACANRNILSDQLLLELVQKDNSIALVFINESDKTPELCLEAVKKFGLMLEFVDDLITPCDCSLRIYSDENNDNFNDIFDISLKKSRK